MKLQNLTEQHGKFMCAFGLNVLQCATRVEYGTHNKSFVAWGDCFTQFQGVLIYLKRLDKSDLTVSMLSVRATLWKYLPTATARSFSKSIRP